MVATADTVEPGCPSRPPSLPGAGGRLHPRGKGRRFIAALRALRTPEHRRVGLEAQNPDPDE